MPYPLTSGGLGTLPMPSCTLFLADLAELAEVSLERAGDGIGTRDGTGTGVGAGTGVGRKVSGCLAVV